MYVFEKSKQLILPITANIVIGTSRGLGLVPRQQLGRSSATCIELNKYTTACSMHEPTRQLRNNPMEQCVYLTKETSSQHDCNSPAFRLLDTLSVHKLAAGRV